VNKLRNKIEKYVGRIRLWRVFILRIPPPFFIKTLIRRWFACVATFLCELKYFELVFSYVEYFYVIFDTCTFFEELRFECAFFHL